MGENKQSAIATRRVILDLEANGLRDVTKIWCIVCKDIDTGEVFRFRPNTPFSGHVDFAEEFLAFIVTCSMVIGHNIVAYDAWAIEKLLGYTIPHNTLVDTLVLSRLYRPISPFKELYPTFQKLGLDTRLGGHSLDAWGQRLGFPKTHFDDWTKYTEEQLEYCENDVHLTHLVYLQLIKEGNGFSEYSVRLEHKVAHLLAEQERNGFYLDQTKAQALIDETRQLLDEMDRNLQIIFPPIFKHIRTLTPTITKSGELGKVHQRIIHEYQTNPELKIEANDDGSYELYVKEYFNAESPQQVASRLMGLGWKPKKFTDKGAPKTDKDTIKEAVAELIEETEGNEQLRFLADYNIVSDRNQKALKWLELVEEDKRVHGQINPIGAGTHRCSHFNDNMANIARVVTAKMPLGDFRAKFSFDPLECGPEKFTPFNDGSNANRGIFLHASEKEVEYAAVGLKGAFGWDSRDCWVAAPGKMLVGVDASGIQLRALAHYMNDPVYTENLIKGDIHTVHQQAAGITTRAKSKTFIYAWLLGAGDEKIGSVVGTPIAEWDYLFDWAAEKRVYGRQNLLDASMSKLRKMKRKADKKTVATIIKGYKIKEQFLERIPALKRLRKEEIPAATKRGYLVGLDGRKFHIPSEHLAMSFYLQGFEAVVMKLAMCYYHKELFAQGIPVSQVSYTHDEYQIECLPEHTDIVGPEVVKAIEKAGMDLGSNCPLTGEWKKGRSWAETH